MTVFGKCGSIFTVKNRSRYRSRDQKAPLIKRADNWRDKEALSGFQGIFPVIDVEIALSFQNKMYGINSGAPLGRRTDPAYIFPSRRKSDEVLLMKFSGS